MKETCPCCQKVFEFSLNENSMGNVVSCIHCQSTLKWTNSSFEIIYNSNLEEEDTENKVLSQEYSKNINHPKQDPHYLQASAVSMLKDSKSPAGIEQNTNNSPDSSSSPEEPKSSSHLEQQHLHPLPNPLSSPEESEMTHLQQAPVGSSQNSLHPEKSEELLEQPIEPISKEDPQSTQESPQSTNAPHHLNTEQLSKKQSFSDVEAFGNTELTSEKGFLRYDLCIANIDSSELEQELFRILEDPRFNWSAKEILSTQKNGILNIRNLNPVKMFRLVSDLSLLPINLSWKQYTAVESNSPENLPHKEEQESV